MFTSLRTLGFRLGTLLLATHANPNGYAQAGFNSTPRPKSATLSVAAAANLVHVLDPLQSEFRRISPGIIVSTATGASGSLFAQIKNGAPFDLFLSADADFPREAVAAGLADGATLRTFATGRLVLWTTLPDLALDDIAAAVRSPRVGKIAIAQPRTAPYGRAAQAALQKLGAWPDAQPKLVIGESITQTAQFVETGNAEAGFVALSLVMSPKLANKGHWVEVPASLYSGVSLGHTAVLTKRGVLNPAAQQYLDFLTSPAGKKILRDNGYTVAP